jgi:hypothetical protein
LPIGDEAHSSDWELCKVRVPDGGAALLAVYEPGWFLILRLGLVDRDEELAGYGVVNVLGRPTGYELNPLVECEDQGVGEHRPVRLQVAADRLDVAEDLRSLVPLQLLLIIPADTRDCGEVVQLLAVDSKAEDLSTALAYEQGWESQRVSVGHIIS